MTVNQITLADAISKVIEDLAMMAADPVNEVEDFAPDLQGWIEFTGPVSGKLTIRCRESLAKTLAANLLGLTPEDMESNAVAWDALAELLNVVCGNLVSTLYDSEKSFTLTPPQINVIEALPPADNTQMEETPSTQEIQNALLMLESEPAEFTLAINK
jgi:CheY-specific phosphatase CheX